MTLAVLPTTERITWPEAVQRMDWRQGEHVTLVGPTGVGKTELMATFLRVVPWWVFFSTKRVDRTLDLLKPMRPLKIERGQDLNAELGRKFILAPKWSRRMSPEQRRLAHAREFSAALDTAFWQMGWLVAIDEGEYINRILRIDDPVNQLLTQGRSQGNSLLFGTQRPRHVTLHAYEQATHLFIWRMSDMANIMRAAELAGVNRQAVVALVATLGKHDVLYTNTIDGTMFITNTRWE